MVIADKFFKTSTDKTSRLISGLNKSTEKYLKKLEKKERKMQRRLWRTDSTAAKQIFSSVQANYTSLKTVLTAKEENYSNMYSAHLDSITTAIKFFDKAKIFEQSSALQSQTAALLKNYGTAQQKLNQTHFIEQQIQERQVSNFING